MNYLEQIVRDTYCTCEGMYRASLQVQVQVYSTHRPVDVSCMKGYLKLVQPLLREQQGSNQSGKESSSKMLGFVQFFQDV